MISLGSRHGGICGENEDVEVYKKSDDQNSFSIFLFEPIILFNQQRYKWVTQKLMAVLTLVMRFTFASYRLVVDCWCCAVVFASKEFTGDAVSDGKVNTKFEPFFLASYHMSPPSFWIIFLIR